MTTSSMLKPTHTTKMTMGARKKATTTNTINKVNRVSKVNKVNKVNHKEMVIMMSSMLPVFDFRTCSNDDAENTIMPTNRVHIHRRMVITMRIEEVRYHISLFIREMLSFFFFRV